MQDRQESAGELFCCQELIWWGSPPPPHRLRTAQIKAKFATAEGLGAFLQERLAFVWPTYKEPTAQLFFFFFLILAKEVMD